MTRVIPIPPGWLGIDTSVKLNAERAKAIRDWGVRFVVRTLPPPGYTPAQAGCIDAAEADAILGADLGLMLYQRPNNPGWTASSEGGVKRGLYAVQCAEQANVLHGTSIAYDAEETASGIDDACAEMTAYYAHVKDGGFHPPCYIGAGMPLTAADWYHRTPFEAYWKSLSDVPMPVHRSVCMFQVYPQQTLAGIPVDFNVAQNDYLGGAMRIMVAN